MAERGKRGADALVKAMARAGVRRVFTLSGNHIMPVFDAALDAGIELVHVRHEAAAVHMADASARLTGEVGVAMVTGGPGHANAVAALYTAGMAESPIVLLSGHAPRAELGMGAFQEMRQAQIAAPLAKASWTCESGDAVGADFLRACGLARAARPGPVHLSLPQDALEAPALQELVVPPVETQALSAADAKALVDRLATASRPLVLTGPASLTRGACARTLELQQALGVPVVAMESPRGVNDPALGAFAEMLARADCVLLLGKRLDFTLRFARPPAMAADCAFLQVDAQDEELARTRRAVGSRLQMALRADAGASLAALIAAARPVASRSWKDEMLAAISHRPAAWNAASSGAGRLHPVQALRPLQALLDAHPDAVLVCDGGEIGQWAQACLHAPRRVINGVAGSIGAGLPFAAAAAAAVPGAPVVAVMGDGTFGFHAAEIDTAVRYGLAFVAVVGNDARWNAEYQIQLRDYGAGRLVGCELLPTRYDQVAAAFGGYGELVTESAQLLPAAHRALASKKPAVLNVMIEGVPAPVVRRG
jgi:acetolactate synthase-1/2/3 large subunit